MIKLKMFIRALMMGVILTAGYIYTMANILDRPFAEYSFQFCVVGFLLVVVAPIMTCLCDNKQYVQTVCKSREEKKVIVKNTARARRAATVHAFFAARNDVSQPIQSAPQPSQVKPKTAPRNQTQAPQSAPKSKPAPETPAQNAAQDTPGGMNIRTVNTSVTFDDIAGYEETKKNLMFIVKCMQKPELLEQVGGKIPSGVLLYGPPGTGKTLLASAMAGTAGVNFYTANASEFVNTFVGVGPKNIRALYEEARKNAPSIIFIDEIDAIGGKRNELQGQEYRMTLNALLSEMDGIEKNGVMTIAATNTFEELDPALIRPGRFDRKVMVPLPNLDDRLAIIKLYAAKRKLAEDVSLENLARDSAGLSGSAIATIFNEASLRAVMADRGIITAADIDGALTQVLTNGENSKNKNRKDLEIIAYHEAGHAVIIRKLCGGVVPKVTIMGSTTGMAGATFTSNEEERLMMSMQQIRNKIIATYGGRAAEEIIFGQENVSTGASQDIQVASRYIRSYMQFGGTNGSLLDTAAFSGQKGASASEISEAQELSKQLYQEAIQFLTENKESLERVAQALLDRETLFEDDLNDLL